MIYNKDDYRARFYKKNDGFVPILKYLEKLDAKDRAKIAKYVEFLRLSEGVLR